MKKCPFCAEEIQDEAIKCKHCGEFLSNKPHGNWYFKPYIIIIALISVGPFALPLVWLNPSYSRRKKVIISVIVLILSVILYRALTNAVQSLGDYYNTVLPGGF